MDEAMEALLPCPTPWCPRNDEIYPEEMEGGFVRYSCDGCGVKGPASVDEAAAAKLWNTRTPNA